MAAPRTFLRTGDLVSRRLRLIALLDRADLLKFRQDFLSIPSSLRKAVSFVKTPRPTVYVHGKLQLWYVHIFLFRISSRGY